MADIIRLLPDSVANQIAAGEVIQRPGSVVKELVENAIDAHSSVIQILLKDAGRTSIQVIDNGDGMSESDALLAFQRHATSKISDAHDLFSIQTLGFRGEALASIAAIAEVKLRTKRKDSELGTQVEIAASKTIMQEQVSCQEGSSFTVRNLFYNTPARRKFLKANTTELRFIVTEFQRVSLAHPEIEFVLQHNNVELYKLAVSNFRQRITNVFGKSINQHLLPINSDTSIVKISGFIGKPEAAKRNFGDQFFFVNNRFIKHPFFHKGVMKAYEHLLMADYIPAYFIYLEMDSEAIDINIHPTKTEVKFEDESSIFQILVAALKETLGKFNVVPSIDFTIDPTIEMPAFRSDHNVSPPQVNIDTSFNPFQERGRSSFPNTFDFDRSTPNQWESLYNGLEKSENEPATSAISEPMIEYSGNVTFQLKNKYIMTAVKSGLMIIDQKRAHERILFERYYNTIQLEQGIVQRTLFPETVELSVEERNTLSSILKEVSTLGFDIELGVENAVILKGYPNGTKPEEAALVFLQMIRSYENEDNDPDTDKKYRVAKEMARASAIPYGRILGPEEMRDMVDHLFACTSPNYSPFGKPIISILSLSELEKRF